MNKLLALLTALLFSCQVQAIQINNTGDSWTVNWLVSASSTPGLSSDLTATSSWLVTSFSATQIALDISITNTTLLTGLLTNADITTFGFGVSPDATASIATAGSTFTQVSTGSGPQQTFPGGYKGINVCIFASGCAGGTVNNALNAGSTDSLKLLLTGNFGSGSANLSYFPIKFQTNQGSYEPAGCVNGNGCTTVPEPGMAGLLLIGLLGITGITILRRKKSLVTLR
jgi:hypothetical protein